MTSRASALVLAAFVLGISASEVHPQRPTDQPAWLMKLIREFARAPVANPPLYIDEYQYRGQRVYYVPSTCCEIPSVLYDSTGAVMCSPSGGMTGDGDGTCRDFFKVGTHRKPVWKDARSYPDRAYTRDPGLVRATAQVASAPRTASASVIPLRQGLIVVSAVFNEDLGDYESTKKIVAVTGDQVKIDFAGQQVRIGRTVRRADLASARVLHAGFNNDDSDVVPGTTAIGTSAAVLQELLTKGETGFGLDVDESGVHRGVLNRVAGPAAMSVIVNDERVDLPVVRARGKLDGHEAAVVFLNDPANPLVLQYRFLDRKLDVIRIAYPVDKSRIENALATTKRAVVYGIYFDFASDRIRPESEPVLREIADALRKNPEWVLTVAGHTDNIGSDTDNQELSERRAAAVKQSLVKRYGVGERRLTTAGFGESRPVDDNETLQGRARNRRVELVRM